MFQRMLDYETQKPNGFVLSFYRPNFARRPMNRPTPAYACTPQPFVVALSRGEREEPIFESLDAPIKISLLI